MVGGVGLDGCGGTGPPAIIASRSNFGACGAVFGGAGAPARPRGGFEGILLACGSVTTVRVRGLLTGFLVPSREWYTPGGVGLSCVPVPAVAQGETCGVGCDWYPY